MNQNENSNPKSSGYTSSPGYGKYTYDPELLRGEDGLDFKRYLTLFLSNWYWFTIAVFVTLSIAYGINRWSEKIYTVSASLLIEDQQRGGDMNSAEQFIPGSEIFKSQQNLKNEIGILRSFTLNYEVIKGLPEFWVTYTGVGRRGIAESRMYKNAPFKVIFDSLGRQLKGRRIDIELLSEDKFRLRLDDKVDTVLSFGDRYQTHQFDFIIVANDNYLFNKTQSNRYYFWFESLESLVNKYRGKLNISSIDEEASLLALSISGYSAAQEADYLNKLMEVYIDRGLKLKNETAENTITFINEQLGLISDSLRLAENNLENFRLNNKLIDLSSEASLLQSRLEKYENEKYNLEFEKHYYEYLVNYVDTNKISNEILSPSLVGITNPTLDRLVIELSAIQQQSKQMTFTLKQDIPSVILIQSRVKDAKKALRENVENSFKNSTKLLNDVNARILEVEREIQKLPGTERQLINIQRKFDLNNTVYNYLLEKRAEAGIAKASNVANNRVIDNAQAFNASRVEPKERHNYMVALILGFFIPAGLLLIFDLLNNKIIYRRDIEKVTDLPIIGFVGHREVDSEMPVVNNPSSSLTESFRAIRTRLKHFTDNEESKIIAITSTVSGEGKTFISANIASVIAMVGKKVLLVGLDLRRPKLHKILDTDNDKGLTSYLIGESEYKDIVLKTNISNLFFVPSGHIPPNPAELIESDRMSKFFEMAKQEYDYIIVDTPPIAIVTDTFLLALYVDINLFVVRQRYSSKNTLNLIDDFKNQGDLKNMAILINDISLTGYYGYGIRYGDSFGYGYNYYSQYVKYGYYESAKGYYTE